MKITNFIEAIFLNEVNCPYLTLSSLKQKPSQFSTASYETVPWKVEPTHSALFRILRAALISRFKSSGSRRHFVLRNWKACSRLTNHLCQSLIFSTPNRRIKNLKFNHKFYYNTCKSGRNKRKGKRKLNQKKLIEEIEIDLDQEKQEPKEKELPQRKSKKLRKNNLSLYK